MTLGRVRPQRILLIGASGFLGTAIHVALVEAGHAVVALYHHSAPKVMPARTGWRGLDIGRTSVEAWRPLLESVDVVINCAGVLQDSPFESTRRVHLSGVGALVQACERAGIRRLVHFSAIGVDKREVTQFARSKLAGEKLIEQSRLDWVILRPSIVLGEGAFGGSALVRGLAALPILPVMPDTAPIQPVQQSDVTRTVLHFLDDVPGRVTLNLAGPEVQRFD